MACTPLPRLLAALLIVAACSDDGTGDAGDPSTGAVVVTDPASTPTTSGATEDTTATSSATDIDGTTSSVDPTTTSTSTTTGDDTTSSTTDDDTGPICDPGQPGCVCDGGACVDDHVCQDGVCTAALVCDGDAESPGEAEDAPTPLADITDNDDDFHQVTGVLSGATDVDWYKFHGSDTLGYYAEPTVDLLTMGSGLRLCMFFECDNGGVAQTDLDCPDGTKFAISGDLRPGCCHSAGFQVTGLDCAGNDESSQIFIRLDQPAADTCVDYEFKAHF